MIFHSKYYIHYLSLLFLPYLFLANPLFLFLPRSYSLLSIPFLSSCFLTPFLSLPPSSSLLPSCPHSSSLSLSLLLYAKSYADSPFLIFLITCSCISPLIPLFPAISHNLILTSPSNLLNSITIVTSGSRSFTLDRNSAEIESRQVNKYYTWKGFIENKFANKEINSRH